jgi:hypothetical protein
MRMNFVLAFKSRLSLLGMISIFKQHKRLVGVASDEETVLHYVQLCRPGMLLCGDPDGRDYNKSIRSKFGVKSMLQLASMMLRNSLGFPPDNATRNAARS